MTTERVLETPMRILLGILGVIALGLGIAVGITEFRGMRSGSPIVPAVLVICICALVAVGGAVLIRGAIRGQITVRRPGHRSPII